MPEIFVFVFAVLFIVIWFIISITASVFWVKTKYDQKIKAAHWTLKTAWWYGFFFIMFIVISIFSSFIFFFVSYLLRAYGPY